MSESPSPAPTATFDDFLKVDIRVARIVEVNDFPEARSPSYRLTLDCGPTIGLKKSCARFPARYTKEQLEGVQVLCVVNFPPRQIGPAMSEVLVLGVPDEGGEPIVVSPEREVPLGGRLY